MRNSLYLLDFVKKGRFPQFSFFLSIFLERKIIQYIKRQQYVYIMQIKRALASFGHF